MHSKQCSHCFHKPLLKSTSDRASHILTSLLHTRLAFETSLSKRNFISFILIMNKSMHSIHKFLQSRLKTCSASHFHHRPLLYTAPDCFSWTFNLALIFFTSAEEKRLRFYLCLFVCFFVRYFTQKVKERILMKFTEKWSVAAPWLKKQWIRF